MAKKESMKENLKKANLTEKESSKLKTSKLKTLLTREPSSMVRQRVTVIASTTEL